MSDYFEILALKTHGKDYVLMHYKSLFSVFITITYLNHIFENDNNVTSHFKSKHVITYLFENSRRSRA